MYNRQLLTLVNFQIIQTFKIICTLGTLLHLNQAKTFICYNTLLYPLKSHGNQRNHIHLKCNLSPSYLEAVR